MAPGNTRRSTAPTTHPARSGRSTRADIRSRARKDLGKGAVTPSFPADRAAIVELGVDPDLDPGTLVARSSADYHKGTRLKEMLEAALLAERIAIESYREMIAHIGDRDTTTRRLPDHSPRLITHQEGEP